jgi:hypothetical protein
MPANPSNLGLLEIRFQGAELRNRGVPIYELSVSLIALQRMVHKAHMLETQQEASRPFLSYEQRSNLALQLGYRHRGSDEYGLIPLLANPTVAQILGVYVGWIMIALTKYAKKAVTRQARGEDDRQHIFNVFIFNQLSELAGRIHNIGGVESMQISGGPAHARETVTLDVDFKNYVRTLKDDVAHGAIRELTGRVVDLLPGEDAIKITRDPEGTVKIFLKPADFVSIRYSKVKNPLVSIVGEPLYRLGIETYHFEAFDGHSIAIINEASSE